MPRKAKTTVKRAWTRADQTMLKQLMKQKVATKTIAKKLNRTMGALYQYASANGISFRRPTARGRARA